MSKSPDAFRTISEVSEWLETPAHVLRFWESKFTQVKPVKRAGGRRYYRPGDMELLGGIKKLLHDDGMTIKGVQKVLREQGVRYVAGLSAPVDGDDHIPGEGLEGFDDAPFTHAEEETGEVVQFRQSAVEDAELLDDAIDDDDDMGDPEDDHALDAGQADFDDDDADDAPGDDQSDDEDDIDFSDIYAETPEIIEEDQPPLDPLPEIDADSDVDESLYDEPDAAQADAMPAEMGDSAGEDLPADEEDAPDMARAAAQFDPNQGVFAFDTPEHTDDDVIEQDLPDHAPLEAATPEPRDASETPMAPLPEMDADEATGEGFDPEFGADDGMDAEALSPGIAAMDPDDMPAPEADDRPLGAMQTDDPLADRTDDADGTDLGGIDFNEADPAMTAEAEDASVDAAPYPDPDSDFALDFAPDEQDPEPADITFDDTLSDPQSPVPPAVMEPAKSAPAAKGLKLPDFTRPEDAGPDQVNPGLLGYALRVATLDAETAERIAQQLPALRARLTRLSAPLD